MKTTTVSKQIGDNNHTQKTNRSFISKYVFQSEFIWYSIGVILRIFWTLIYPQQGYIHPDEFFQGPEVIFDDIFQTNLTRTHEFNPSAPLRSVAILYLLYGLPVSILSYLSSILHWSSIPFNLKLIFPRLTILLFSLCTDFLFYRLMKFFYPNFNSKQYGIMMNYYGISHVTLVFFTRTLSNSFESFLFLILIYLININISSILSILIQGRLSQELKSTIITSSLIGLICSLGIFNRPTFPAFAFVPLIYWLINIIPLIGHSTRFHLLLGRIIFFIIGTFLLTSSLLILFDSYYYNNGFSFLNDLKNRLIICPLNFILYNIDSTNLDKHGLHPPWLHFIVNATILYGPLHLCGILWGLFYILNIKVFGQSIINRFLNIFSRQSNEENSISPLLLCLYLIPLLFLSAFPHQEPRFLLPLIFPLILFITPLLIKQNLHKYIFRLWLVFNIIITIIYGHMHQGGLLPALKHIHDFSSNISSIKNEKFVVTYHTYMPPGYLVTSMTKFETTIIIDLKGAKREELDLTIEKIFNENLRNNIQVFLVLPGTCRTDLIYLKEQKYSFNLLKQFGPHLDFDHNFEEPFHVKYAGTKYQWIHTIWEKYKLDLYQVTRG